MQNTRLNEAQAGIKIVERNIRYVDDTTVMAESKEELKSLLMRVKEESERASLRLNIYKKLRSCHLAPLLHANRRGKCRSSYRFSLFGL